MSSEASTLSAMARFLGEWNLSQSRSATNFLSVSRSAIIGFLEYSCLPHSITFRLQRDGELDLHVARGVVGHRVRVGVELRQQAQAVALHVAVGLDAGLVLFEALLGREAGAADVDAGLDDVAVRVGGAEARVVEHAAVKLDDVDVVVVAYPARLGGFLLARFGRYAQG